ncbi:Glu-tRNA(Gln) amidotransferase, subunit C [Campylobacter blaseri]|uniref:Glutamyl-tRNA(Gln) amidotransferase subunit C n=1 Tax=Campylobacter blaseri TaxID=2042961 RepID=A0A2P8R1D9_9BACT|nr:Asp-tRNA(Asn)/Glu-tRNA(Gln) amidotransferase subunit GatC [Campylobacter blaseri]PSM52316.1 Asp-tRNA(Asn)/Glu-tRNA(Gln) amidotransferase GatCAB subunit C [Campylobacter blaseri]PSM54082.1 Asp-tRNA(Asn)/Glu-tRNA(Gln) amidotransferase GatCAB subunit C [Campylobacter blaseri]QKF85524.1 Glu-tRNA(Gln) amidotransferase, subunit C [Campylobacter blaseri]
MLIDDKLLNSLEKLSALKINDNKKDTIKKQLSEIVSFVEILNDLDFEKNNITLNSTKNGVTPLREDIPSQNKEVVEIILKNTPYKENHSFVVPKIIE